MALASDVIAGNDTLADHARQAGAARVAVIPTGLDVRRYGPADKRGPAGFLRLAWIGSRSTLKQLQQLRPVLEGTAV